MFRGGHAILKSKSKFNISTVLSFPHVVVSATGGGAALLSHHNLRRNDTAPKCNIHFTSNSINLQKNWDLSRKDDRCEWKLRSKLTERTLRDIKRFWQHI